MAKEETKEGTKEFKSKVKVVLFGDYIPKIPDNFQGNRTIRIIEMIYSENKVIDRVERKGETYFICEV